MLAVYVKSTVEVPESTSKFLSMYLLFAIGLKGGHELSKSGLNSEHLLTLLACILAATVIPIITFFIFRLKLSVANSAALAATYGSISAVTFIAAGSFLSNKGIEHGGFIVAGMALMESPAIIVGIILNHFFNKDKTQSDNTEWKLLLGEAFFGGSVYLLLGALIIGLLSGDSGWDSQKFFADSIFKGFLSFFLLDKGIESARKMGELKDAGFFLISFGIIFPPVASVFAALLAKMIGMNIGDALMFTVLVSSASYIAVPAAMKHSIPDANPSLYIPMALAVTFPFNVLVGIPLYFQILKYLGFE